MRRNSKKLIYSALGILLILIISILIIIVNRKNNKSNNIKGVEEEQIDKEKLEIDFNDLFNNEENEYVSTLYKIQEDKSGKYKIEAYIPYIHVNDAINNKINNEIYSAFADKILQVYNNSQLYTIIKINYATTVENNRLSIAIKCVLKEGSNAQRTIIKTYNYDMETNQPITVEELVQEQKKADLQDEINQKIQMKIKKEITIADQGYNVYRRDATSEIYQLENATEFYIKNNIMYIIYCYGNNSYTSEVDLIITKI